MKSKKMLAIFVLALVSFIGGLANTAVAQEPDFAIDIFPAGPKKTNLGEESPVIFTGHVLTTEAPCQTCSSILYAPSNPDDATYRAAISAACGGATVDYYDTRVATPSVALLSKYDCVHTWANWAYANKVQFGHNLADYVDTGGTVVLGVFCTFTQGNYLAGRIMTSGYCPVNSPLGNNHFSWSDYAGDGKTCIHAGITNYSCYYRDYLVLQGSGLQDGSYYPDGEIAHAYRPDFKVIYSNGTGHSLPKTGTGQWPELICNACSCRKCPLKVEPPEDFVSDGNEGGPFEPDCNEYTLTNTGTDPLVWDVCTPPWLDAYPSSGNLAASATTTVTVCTNAYANDLEPCTCCDSNTYTGTITFYDQTNNCGETRDATLTVYRVPGEIEVTDSIPPPNDHNMPFGDVIVGLSRTEQVTITNIDPNPRHEVCIEDIYLDSASYSEDFSSGLPGSSEGWEFFKQGRIEVVSGKMRMYSYYSGYDLNEAILHLDLAGKNNVVLSFWQGKSYYEDSHYLPATFTGHSYDDGVAISEEGDRFLGSRKWYTIVNASELNTAGTTFTVDLDAEVERIRRDYDPDFGYSGDFCIKFQQYDNYSDEYREWDDIYVYWDDAFSLYLPEDGPPWTLAGGECMVVDVNFAPTDFIDYRSDIVIQANIVVDANNDPKNQVEISMSGTGIPEYLNIACVNDVEFAGHPGGPFMPTWSSCDLTNNGPIDVNWSVNGPNWVDVSPSSGILEPNELVTVTFWPNDIADGKSERIYDANLIFKDETTTIEQERNISLVVYTKGKICVEPVDFDILVPQGNIVTETLTIGNCGDADLSYTVSSDKSWLGISQDSGIVGPGDANQITVTFDGNREVGTRDANLLITSNDPYNTAFNIPAKMSIIGVDYFTEIFDPNENDVSNFSVTFTPDDSGSYYRACGNMVSEFPVDPTGGTPVPLGDDDYAAVTLDGTYVNLYGTDYDTFYIGSNGFVTFLSGDYRYFENLSEHFELPRIAALWDDLDPSSGGTVSWKQLGDRIAVTFENIPELYTVNSNSFQIEMFYDGHIRITWLNIAATDGLVGLSDGYGEPAFYAESDMSGYSACTPIPGDLNYDFHVDMIDFAIFSLCWRKHESLMETVRDEFNAVDYSGNDGSLNWSNSWIEYGEVDGPASGVLQVLADGAMRIGSKHKIGPFDWSLTREADLGTATTATLRFDYAADPKGKSGFVNVQVSDDEGFNWYTLAAYPHNAASGSASYDISSWISSNTQIRFEVDPSVNLRMFFNVDNVEIEYGNPDQPWYSWCNGRDFNQDWRIDFVDLRIFCEHWLE